MGKGAAAKQEVTEYRMSLHYGVCKGPVTFKKISIGEDKVIWEGSIDEVTYVDVNLPSLFGGPTKEGGVAGRIWFLPGKPNQVMPAELASRYGLTPANCPAYRGIASVFFVGSPSSLGLPFGSYGANAGGFYWTANSPFIQAVQVEVEAVHTGLNATNHKIGDIINPAHIIYECLTNTDFGMGAPLWLIDKPSFEYLAQQMVDEEFGLSLVWSKQSDIENFVSEVIDHIQATIFVNPLNGLLSIKALRDDYDLETIREINPGNAKMKSFSRKLWGETSNEIILTWTNPLNEQEETITGHDAANMAIQGVPISDSRNMYAVRSAELAQRILDRELRQVSAPLVIGEFELDRTFWNTLPGEVLRLTWPKYNIQNLIVRVTQVTNEEGPIVISVLQDIFSLTKPLNQAPPSTEWTGVADVPAPMTDVEVITMPYFLAAREIVTQAQQPQYPEVMAGVLAYKAGEDTIAYDLAAEVSLANGTIVWENSGTKSVLGRGRMITPMYQEAVSQVQGLPLIGLNRGPQIGNLAILGAGGDGEMEFVLLRSFAAGVWTVDRGILDTVPRSWPIDTPVWFLPLNSVIADENEFRAIGETVEYKLLTRTSLGTLDIPSAPVVTGLMTPRPHAPLRPANVKINSVGFGEVDAAGASNLTVTWSTRNRLFEDTIVTPWTNGPVTPEQNQMTIVTIYRQNGAKMFHYRGLYTENSVVIPIAYVQQETRVFIRVSSERDGISSLQSYGLWVDNIPQIATPAPPPADFNGGDPPPPPPPPSDPTPEPPAGVEPPPQYNPGGGGPREWSNLSEV